MYSHVMLIDSVQLRRELEVMMLREGSVYDQGRIGSEIAYLCGTKYLGLRNLVIEEPSKDGKDLYSLDEPIAIQSRMISSRTRHDFELSIQEELLKLARKLRVDFNYNPRMTIGYAVLSFVDLFNAIQTILLKVTSQNRINHGSGSMGKEAGGGFIAAQTSRVDPSTLRLRGVRSSN